MMTHASSFEARACRRIRTLVLMATIAANRGDDRAERDALRQIRAIERGMRKMSLRGVR